MVAVNAKNNEQNVANKGKEAHIDGTTKQQICITAKLKLKPSRRRIQQTLTLSLLSPSPVRPQLFAATRRREQLPSRTRPIHHFLPDAPPNIKNQRKSQQAKPRANKSVAINAKKEAEARRVGT